MYKTKVYQLLVYILLIQYETFIRVEYIINKVNFLSLLQTSNIYRTLETLYNQPKVFFVGWE